MRWSLKKLNLRWYEYGWAALPLVLAPVGGVLGALCGGAAAALNLYLMRGTWRTPLKYGLTGIISLAAVGAYIALAHTISLKLITPTTVDRDLQKLPAYVALKKIEPTLYAKLVDEVTDAASHGAGAAGIKAITARVLGSVVVGQLAHASDDAVIDAGRLLTLQLDQIGAKSADACFAFLFPRPGAPIDIAQYVSPEVTGLDADTTVAILETAGTNPRPIPSHHDIEAALGTVRNRLLSVYGEDAVNQLRKPAAMDHGQLCRMTSSLYKEVLSLPRAQSVPLLRYLLTQPSST